MKAAINRSKLPGQIAEYFAAVLIKRSVKQTYLANVLVLVTGSPPGNNCLIRGHWRLPPRWGHWCSEVNCLGNAGGFPCQGQVQEQ